MINSEKDFKDLDNNIENIGSGCMYIILAALILIIYVILF